MQSQLSLFQCSLLFLPPPRLLHPFILLHHFSRLLCLSLCLIVLLLFLERLFLWLWIHEFKLLAYWELESILSGVAIQKKKIENLLIVFLKVTYFLIPGFVKLIHKSCMLFSILMWLFRFSLKDFLWCIQVETQVGTWFRDAKNRVIGGLL